jgi:hypothetical protein
MLQDPGQIDRTESDAASDVVRSVVEDENTLSDELQQANFMVESDQFRINEHEEESDDEEPKLNQTSGLGHSERSPSKSVLPKPLQVKLNTSR